MMPVTCHNGLKLGHRYVSPTTDDKELILPTPVKVTLDISVSPIESQWGSLKYQG